MLSPIACGVCWVYHCRPRGRPRPFSTLFATPRWVRICIAAGAFPRTRGGYPPNGHASAVVNRSFAFRFGRGDMFSVFDRVRCHARKAPWRGYWRWVSRVCVLHRRPPCQRGLEKTKRLAFVYCFHSSRPPSLTRGRLVSVAQQIGGRLRVECDTCPGQCKYLEF